MNAAHTADLRTMIDAYAATAPLERAATPPKGWYTDPRMAELERRAVFGRTWQSVGRAEQVREPGAYLTADVAGEPVVVARGRDGGLRAFFNVCRHHAAIVMPQPCGHATGLKCPYHGWTYSLEGELKSCGEFEGVVGFDRAQNGLVAVRAAEWEQFVFVCLDESAPPLPEFLGTLADRAAPLRFGALRFAERRTYDLRCNWKVFVDNYLDGGYHVPHAHESLGSVLDYARYTIENEGRVCVQSSPIDAAGGDAQTAAVRGGDRAWYFWLYPNFMLNWYEGYLDTNLVLPLDVNSCRVIFDFYFADAGDDAAAKQRQSIAVAERVQQEDIDVCESVQRGLASRAYETGRLSVRREKGEQLFHQLLHADLRQAV